MKTTQLMRYLTGIAALPLAFTACSAQDNAAPQATPAALEAPAAIAAPTVREAKPALWVIKDADTTIYLFGTVHILPKDVQWFDGTVKQAFDSSDALVLEMTEPNMGEMMQLMNKYGNATDGVKLSDRMDEATRTNYQNTMTSMGLPVMAFEGKKPWLAYITIYALQLMQSGWDENSGAENILTAAAKEQGKPILALESAEEQFAIISGISIEDQLAMLGQVVNDPDGSARELGVLLDHWMAGDDTAIGLVMAESLSQSKAVEHDLLTKRNANWTVWLDKKMDEPGTYFVAVGAAHLAGDNSVQLMLAEQGLIAERVPN